MVYDDGSGRPRTYDLACGPGTARGADPAGEQDGCRHLQEIGGPVGAVPAGQMCSMIYGGPQTADVRGTWAGRPVAESYRRTNGCEVSRWSRMVPALPNPASPPAPHRRPDVRPHAGRDDRHDVTRPDVLPDLRPGPPARPHHRPHGLETRSPRPPTP